MSRVVALIVAAGKGERAGLPVAKQFARLGGTALVAHAFDSLARHPKIDGVVVVTGADQHAQLAEALGHRRPIHVVDGGATRRESVKAGLAAIDDADAVLIHDAARPFVPHAVINRLLSALESGAGAVPALPVADTLARAGTSLGETVERSGLFRVQTPQAFRLDVAVQAHAHWSGPEEPTDDAQMVRAAGHAVAIVDGDLMLDKITRPEDLAIAASRLQRSVRTGLGYDVHRLADGQALWLGGVHIPHSQGLLGHSDADVALHALTDALLGAICAGDIGTHFPPSDPQWRGASSDRFLAHAGDLVSQAGGRIEHVDLTIICEAPKIGPHRAAMQARIADLLGLMPSRVSIKATTTERLGFTGRGEGIAAQAIATISVQEVPE